jgi:hypothetical protein
MSAESVQHKPPVADTTAMIKRKRLEAELASIDSQIRSFGRIRDGLAAAGKDPLAFYRELDARRATLLTDLRSTAVVAAPAPGTLAGRPLRPVGGSLLSLPITPPRWWPGSGVYGFGTTGYVQAGTFADDLNIVPEGQYPVAGDITDVPGGDPGTVMFNGILSVGPGEIDASQYSPAIAYYWLRTWQLVVPFPPPTRLSYLTYQFEAGAFVSLFNGGIGQLMSFVSLGETTDLTQGLSIPVTVDGGWPLDYDLSQPGPPGEYTYNGSYGYLQGQVTVQRTFEVGEGNFPAVAIVVGVAVGLPMQSEVDLFFAGAGYSALGVAAVDQPGPGRIAYSYVPVPVIE